MDLGLSLNIATSGLKTIENELSTASNNVTNASTPGYVSETANTSSTVVSGTGVGATSAANQLNISQPLQDALYQQNARVSGLTATSNSLAAVSAVQGTTTGSDGANTIGTLTNNLQNVSTAFISLSNTPQNSASQQGVVSAAQTLVSNIHTLSSVYQAQRQGAQDAITSTVSGINTDLTTIGQISQQIMLARSSHADTADLANKRLEAMQSLSSKLGVTFTEKPNGDMLVSTQDGTRLPTRPDQAGLPNGQFQAPTATWPLSTKSPATLTPSMYHATDGSDQGVAGIMLAGKDITSHLTDGTLGANLTLRDQTYPQMQAQLDSFSYTLINRFKAAGVPLFTNGGTQPLSSDPTKTAPAGLVGLSSRIAISTDYQQTPSLLTANSDGGQTSALANAVLNKAMGSASASTSGSLAAPSTSLGPDGTQATGYDGTQGLTQLATSLTSSQAGVISQNSSDLSTATSIKTSLTTKVADVSGVDVNSQMSAIVSLKNSYAANAKVVSMVQSMFSTLLDAVH
ncbi:flagellar hook-associated protein FlgK [Parasaccharibacter sp. TMW2.1882]|uniref:flagellar hook-associated protein FlgK n=1 Tax=unclassified Parasaccharibacter TaxID=2626400 RepID=UPI002009E5E7|nr:MULTISPECIES: flagellar hook-associated protein FlgK [unclassified Parasaccharibacter]MCK8637251.1 flagellar hook-associated protein FlgK [Parasaccharibacter sp. TMW2.1885]MCL1497242.1 flagellar hook-associated protein FlgK [Parasaccharibacter sp. TMW2.1882]